MRKTTKLRLRVTFEVRGLSIEMHQLRKSPQGRDGQAGIDRICSSPGFARA
jgi:hypothetical protein